MYKIEITFKPGTEPEIIAHLIPRLINSINNYTAQTLVKEQDVKLYQILQSQLNNENNEQS